jgi:hypothetical protein
MNEAAIRFMVREALEPVRAAFSDLRDRMTAIELRLGMYASDDDLDTPRGDPQIRFVPRNWNGPDYIGKRYSETSPAFLDILAEALQYSADHPKPDKPAKYADYARQDAARARSWARRIRAGVVPPPPEARALAGETEAPQAPSFDAPAFEAPSFGEYSDADEDVPTF